MDLEIWYEGSYSRRRQVFLLSEFDTIV